MTITPIGVGIQTGAALTHYKRIEDSILAGGNTPTSALFQTFQLGYLDSHISRTLEVTGTETLPFYARAFVILSPIALALGIKYYVTDPEWRTFLFNVQKQVGNLCQVIAVVCSVAMIYFGSVILGATSLAMLGIGLLDRKGLLPEKMRQLIHDYSNPLIVCTGLLFGSRFEMIFAGLNFIALCVDKYFEYLDKQEEEEALKNEKIDNLSYSELQDILNDKVETEVNGDYIFYSTLPPVPDVDIEELNTMFDEVEWDENNIKVLRVKLMDDQKFKKEVGDASEKSDEFILDYTRQCLKDFLSSVKNRAVLDGEPRDYQRMEDYLKLIVDFLHHEKNPIARADAVMQLAVEGGRYCGPGKFRAAEEVYQSLVLGEAQTQVPFRTKVLVAIHEAHERELYEIYGGISQHANGKNVLKAVEVLTRYATGQEIVEPTGESAYGVDKAIDVLIDIFFDWSDVHTYNQFVNLFGGAVGVRKASAENDSSAVIHPAISYLIKRKLNLKAAGMRYIKELYSASPRYIISQALGSKTLPKTDLYEWYREWIERQGFDIQTETKLLDDLRLSKLCGKEMESKVTSGGFAVDSKYSWSKTDMTIDEKVIEAMLVDMGILKIKGPKTEKGFTGHYVYPDSEFDEEEKYVSSDS